MDKYNNRNFFKLLEEFSGRGEITYGGVSELYNKSIEFANPSNRKQTEKETIELQRAVRQYKKSQNSYNWSLRGEENWVWLKIYSKKYWMKTSQIQKKNALTE